MTIEFKLDGKHVAYINKELLESYREIVSIPDKRENSQVLEDVLYKEILGDEYYTDEVDEKIKDVQIIAKHLRYNSVGEFMEYIMHESINKKADICNNCNKFKQGICYLDDILVSKYSVGCNSLFDEELEDLDGVKEQYVEEKRRVLLRFRTKFGPIAVSDDAGKEFERLARVPLTSVRVEAIISELPDKENTPQEQIDSAVIADGRSDYEELKEIDSLAQNGVLNIDYGITGLSVDLDENGEVVITKTQQ